MKGIYQGINPTVSYPGTLGWNYCHLGGVCRQCRICMNHTIVGHFKIFKSLLQVILMVFGTIANLRSMNLFLLSGCKCRTYFTKKCVPSKKEICHTVYKEACSMTYENVCQNDYHGKTCHKVPKQHCKQVPQKACEYVDSIITKKKSHKECQMALTEYVTVHETQYHPYCEHYPVEKCFMVYKNECTNQQKQHCEMVYDNQCNKQQQNVCETDYVQDCKPSYNYGNQCQSKPQTNCRLINVPICTQVPRQNCQTVNVPICNKVPVQECKTLYAKECQDFVEVPKVKKKTRCVWPDHREHDDPNCGYH